MEQICVHHHTRFSIVPPPLIELCDGTRELLVGIDSLSNEVRDLLALLGNFGEVILDRRFGITHEALKNRSACAQALVFHELGLRTWLVQP